MCLEVERTQLCLHDSGKISLEKHFRQNQIGKFSNDQKLAYLVQILS